MIELKCGDMLSATLKLLSRNKIKMALQCCQRVLKQEIWQEKYVFLLWFNDQFLQMNDKSEFGNDLGYFRTRNCAVTNLKKDLVPMVGKSFWNVIQNILWSYCSKIATISINPVCHSPNRFNDRYFVCHKNIHFEIGKSWEICFCCKTCQICYKSSFFSDAQWLFHSVLLVNFKK